MPAFALPRAVSPRVAATLSRFGHYSLIDRLCQRARTYDIAPTANAGRAASPQGVPEQLTLIFDGADRGTPTQLHLGRVPVPARFWSYDADRGVLAYQFKSGGVDHAGSLTFVHAASRAIGTLSVGNDRVGVEASLRPISYSCDVAITPAAFVTGVAPALSLHWDATDPRWSSATWVENALTFTWQVTGQVVVGQPTYSIAVSFRDQQTGKSWAPGSGEVSALLDANLNFTMTLSGGFTPPPDDRSGLPAPGASIASVFPYVLGFSVSGDADVADAVAAASALAQDKQLRDYVELAQSIASANAGVGAWDQLAPAIQSRVGRQLGAKATSVFMMALASVGAMGVVKGSMRWSSLSADELASLAANGAALAIEFVAAVAKRGVAMAAIWSRASNWEKLTGLVSGDIFKQATNRLSGGFRRWIVERDVDNVGGAIPPGALLWDEVTQEVLVGPGEQSVASKIFGRNLDDFLATRLGAALAVVNLVLSIYDAVHASDPLERVADGLMATTAGLDLIAAVAGWALGAAGTAVISTAAVATICSAIGVLAILAALAGIAILLYMIFRPKQNPVQQFTSTYAQPAGFYMPYGSEIDYFVGYTPGTGSQRVGCSFVVDAGTSTVLSVASNGASVEAAKQSYGYRSVFRHLDRGDRAVTDHHGGAHQFR